MWILVWFACLFCKVLLLAFVHPYSSVRCRKAESNIINVAQNFWIYKPSTGFAHTFWDNISAVIAATAAANSVLSSVLVQFQFQFQFVCR